MTVSINELLGDLRSTALDERDKGDKFERLIKAFLKTDPEWSAKFSDVWLWSEWDGRGNVPDIGVDLVAKHSDRDGFAAIQAKFYDAGNKVSKAHIDSFLAATMRPDFQFTTRFVFDTSAGWTNNVEKELQGVVQRVDISLLDEAAIDWSQYRWETPEVVVSTGKKNLRPHQAAALSDVRAGLATHDRGKLIMACGTGKTFTSLRIAEEQVGAGGRVLFLVPSIQLLSQSLREWMANAEVDIRPFAVCSDVRVGRKAQSDDLADISTIDLTEPATTDAKKLVERMATGRHAKERMTVVFSTYQSLPVVIEAQQQGLEPFDLIICDEAHRTTGVTLVGQNESAFVKVHDNNLIRASKRLYMTATPRVFGDEVRAKAKDADAILADMSDEATYGPELHRLGFGDAVEADLLTDYKVLVLAVDEQYVAENFQNAMAESGEIKLDAAAKLIGCWNGLSKNFGTGEGSADGWGSPMRTAVAFAQNIKASELASAAFPTMVDRALLDVPDGRNALRVQAKHVDGTMGIHDRNTRLSWLKEATPDNVCRILTNARCLSEGVDVPALDAVLFLTPRGSQVDVVQSVGRVMRKAPGKELGYIILPVVVPSGIAPEDALRDNERYKVVWQVLQALRSHDDRFHALVNKLELNKNRPSDKLDIIPISTPRDDDSQPSDRESDDPDRKKWADPVALDFPTDAFRDAMYARIVQKVGERRYWESWARDVADIAAAHVARIKGLLADETSNPAREFEVFLAGLRGNLNDNISRDEAIDMLAQHLVTRPIFEALFDGYDFAANNPVAKTMELMLSSLDEHNLDAENETLEKFYASVRRRIEGVDNAEGKQRILVELYDKFFAVAFKKTVDKLGIVYTPIEIVDFILRSADAVLRQEFGQGLTDEGVHILDGFTGTGTFLVRLLQSGLIEPHDLARKYAEEIHGNEILLLAYYIACVNIETTYAELTGHEKPFPGLILTDTFQSWEPDDRPDLDVFPENNERLEKLKALPVQVVLGNPPWSVGQRSADDDNANESYPALDQSIRETYAARSNAKLKAKIYDSYIRALKWASLRVGDRGIVAFVTNGGFLKANSADGIRLSMEDEFTRVYVLDLRGNQKGDWKLEGGKVFGEGSQAAVAITVLVKNPDAVPARAEVLRSDIGTYLTAEEKITKLVAAPSILSMPSEVVPANDAGDWFDLRSPDFGRFLPLSDVFGATSLGVGTARDAWAYGYSREALADKVRLHVETYESERKRWMARGEGESADVGKFVSINTKRGTWGGDILKHLARGRELTFDPSAIRAASVRPFEKTWLYLDPVLNNRVASQPALFPTGQPNFGIELVSPREEVKPVALMVGQTPDLSFFSYTAQFVPRYRYERVEDSGMLDLGGEGEVLDGYRRIDNITDEALKRFTAAYPSEAVSKDDVFFYVYGLLHSPEYRETYAADLKKMLPRIPLVKDFGGFADAGRKLSDLHLNYESVEPYPLDGLAVEPHGDPYSFFKVGAKKMAFGKPSAEQKAAGERHDRTVIQYNPRVTLSGIPEDAYRYMLGSRSAVEWIIDRYYVKTDKASGIVNDPNDWSREVGDPRYILDLLARVVTVSVETNKIVDGLPALDIIEGA